MWLPVVLFVVILLILAYLDTVKPKNFPPGPRWLPIIGSLSTVLRIIRKHGVHYLAWAELAQEYGTVVGLRLGWTKYILIAGKEAVTEGLAREEFDARPDGFAFRHRTMGIRRGVIFTDGEEWKEQRRFSLRHLRDLGFGTRSMELMLREEAIEMATRLADMGRRAGPAGLDVHKAYTIPVLNSLWVMTAGERHPHDDEKLLKFTGLVNQISRSIDVSGGIFNAIPFLRFLMPRFKEYDSLHKQMWTFFQETVKEHQRTLSDGHPRDLIDVYLQELKEQGEMNGSSFSQNQLIALCKDLFSAGSETTSNTLGFATLFMVRYPEVQAKVHEELDRVVGRDRIPTVDDKPNLPYLNAVLYEVQRICNVAAQSILHRSTEDSEFMGYSIPKGSMLLFNLRSLHMDKKYWGDPEVFRPERFLVPGVNGGPTTVRIDPWLVPFGLGRRRCLGENLAKMSLYVFFSIISHAVCFKNPPGCPLPPTKGVTGFTLGTGPFKAVVEPRF
ncbi:methyl farnesoate epoxidase-like [Ischnura elegans]|uniref:methyl farnesoate epoxidase-like n=1 Tax=Ischnura elegans TaxID=197161 RepID=UPI001ED88612|nr:methyl farnesoate epoxidase-like [Ischnura elegans]